MAKTRPKTKAAKPPRRYYAYCWMSGLIEFGYKVPNGTLPLMQGARGKVLDRVTSCARHGYSTRLVNGRPTKVPGTECLLVPGIPETTQAELKYDAYLRFKKWLLDGHRRTQKAA